MLHELIFDTEELLLQNVNTAEDDPEYALLATLTTPVAPVPIIAVTVESLTTVYDETDKPPTRTKLAPSKLDPLIVIVVPVEPTLGLKEFTIGVANTIPDP